MLDVSGNEVFIVRINGVNIGFGYTTGNEPTAGDTFTATELRDGAAEDSSDGVSASQEPYAGVICNAAGTMILTPEGERSVEDLRSGDLSQTIDAGAQPLRWVGQTALSFKPECHEDKPILISANSLGDGRPHRDLSVSPQHRILLYGDEIKKLFGASEVFAPAKGLCGLNGVRIMRGKRSVTYVHLLLDHHAVLTAEGAPSESYFPGPMGLKMMCPELRDQVFALFPDLRKNPESGFGELARPSISKRQAELVVKQFNLRMEIRKWDEDAEIELRHSAFLPVQRLAG